MVRLKDIALRAGVSVMTVSKALRDETDISATTKTRIKQLAQELGYVPDSIAQGLRNKTTKLLGVVISSTTNPVYARMVMALEDQAYELGYEMILAHTRNTPEREDVQIRRLLSRRVDGIFISPVYRLAPTAPIYEELKRRGSPVVILGHLAAFCSHFPNVETDDIQGSFNATKHLLQIGHRRIAYFSGPVASPFAQERYEGYRRALREFKIEPDEKLIFNAGTTIDEGGKAALQFLNENANATAIQSFNDLVAIGASNILLNQGVKIPKQISMVGFGNILTSEHFRVPLTTVRQPKARLGIAAMESMMKIIRGERPASRRLPAELVIRKSTCAPCA
ncbi:MAG: LacI family DNA-binding transcriptional regulator [Verrucomicrobia bacterium]|nr:LacI family DNA-binding transcriptional regulator [Verrucomicrobiota bacterium]